MCRNGDRVVLTIPAKPEYVSLCRLALAGLGQRCGLDLETVADLKLAVTEACSRAIRHLTLVGASEGAVHSVAVEIGVELEAWVITVGEWGLDAENGLGGGMMTLFQKTHWVLPSYALWWIKSCGYHATSTAWLL